MNPAGECGTTMTPATQYTVSFPVAGTIDLVASIRKDNSLWLDVRAGVQSYLQCFNTDWGSADCWVQIILNRGGMSIEAVVTDYSGNGSSTATLERAAALSQESKAGALFASLPEALFKALGPVTVSAPSLVMLPADVHYTDGRPLPNNDYRPKKGYYGGSYAEETYSRFQFIRTKPYREDYSTDNKPLHDVVEAQYISAVVNNTQNIDMLQRHRSEPLVSSGGFRPMLGAGVPTRPKRKPCGGLARSQACSFEWCFELGWCFVLCVACACVLSSRRWPLCSLGAACRAIPAGLPVPWL